MFLLQWNLCLGSAGWYVSCVVWEFPKRWQRVPHANMFEEHLAKPIYAYFFTPLFLKTLHWLMYLVSHQCMNRDSSFPNLFIHRTSPFVCFLWITNMSQNSVTGEILVASKGRWLLGQPNPAPSPDWLWNSGLIVSWYREQVWSWCLWPASTLWLPFCVVLDSYSWTFIFHFLFPTCFSPV